jgi:hypothetical protein
MNRLYFGDNLQWLRNAKEFPDASVDLVYLDPATFHRLLVIGRERSRLSEAETSFTFS